MSTKEPIIFISSKAKEFASERLIILETLKKLYLKPILSEEYGAEDRMMIEANEDDVKNCHIFIGIYGLEYSEPTYKEFKIAIENNKSCLFYFKKLDDGVVPDEKMTKFITEIKNVKTIYKHFDDVIKLRDAICQDIISLMCRHFIREKYEFPEVIQKHINDAIKIYDGYPLFENFIKNYGTNTKIVEIFKTEESFKIIINKGMNDGLFENIEFNMNDGDNFLLRIRVVNLLEKMSTCIALGKLPYNFENSYSKYSLEVIKLSKKDFVDKVIWRKFK